VLNLKELESKLDTALSKETSESLISWLRIKRQNKTKKYMKLTLTNIFMVLALVLVLVLVFKLALSFLPYLLIGGVIYFVYKGFKNRF